MDREPKVWRGGNFSLAGTMNTKNCMPFTALLSHCDRELAVGLYLLVLRELVLPRHHA